jgi:hypothetical protein
MDLQAHGVVDKTRWVPAHIGIKGNEEADRVAKKGSEQTSSPCNDIRTTITYVRRANLQILFTAWGSFTSTVVTSWKYPEHFGQWNLSNSVAIFRFFSRRTNFDRHFGAQGVRCKCGISDISGIHLLRDCMLFDSTPAVTFRTWGTLPEIGLETVLEDSEVGKKLREFIVKVGLDRGCIGSRTGKVPSQFTR